MPVDLQAVILGIVEGLTEFLPVSSTGHLLLAMSALRVDPQSPSWQVFLYVIQVAAVLAVLVGMGRRVLRLWGPLLAKLVVALIPSVVVGLLFDEAVENHLENPPSIAAALIAGAFLIMLVDRRYRRVDGTSIDEVSWRQALLIGLAQCVSIIPGTSRAMATILGGMVVGLTPAAAVEFSFYLAIPTILGAAVLKVHHHGAELTAADMRILVLGSIAALVSALFVVRWFLGYVSRERMTGFAVYRLALGSLIGLLWALGNKFGPRG